MIYTIHRFFVNDKTMQIRKSEAYRSNRHTFPCCVIHLFLILRYRIIATFYSKSKLHNVNFTHLLFSIETT